MSARERIDLAVGDAVEVECGQVANGGAVIAHHGGRTLLVRHALPGERVIAHVTEVRAKIVRADAVEVLTASSDRVTAPCAAARPGGCGGCDLQHVRLDAQRAWKSRVVGDALRRAGVWDRPVAVESLPGEADGLRWRTRMRWTVAPDGRPGLLRHRSHAVEAVDDCLIASPGIAAWLRRGPHLTGASEVRTTEGGTGEVTVEVDGVLREGPARVVEQVGDRRWRLSPATFWQVHPSAASTLSACAMSVADVRPGETWWDLYAGAGLFSAPLAEAIGPEGRVEAVEASASAIRDARRALHDLPWVRLHASSVERWLPEPGQRPSGVLLDPPRAGAAPEVLNLIAASTARRVVYVSCDPMTLARDLASLGASGFGVREVRAFDTFPMTHHVETVVALTRDGAGDRIS